jgi:hypothetical protein
MATFNSNAQSAMKCGLAVALIIFFAEIAFANGMQGKIFAARAATEFHRTQIQFQSDTSNTTNAWQFARASYDFADFATNDAQRAALANQGIAACRQIMVRQPKTAAAHYYLAMNLGQLARTEFLGALRLVKEMEGEFTTAADLDASFDFAGPARCLGLLYRDAPGWPASIGSKRKSLASLELAAKLAPDYPENHLNLAESYLQWHDSTAAKAELAALDLLWPKAQTNFTGVAWEQSWADWSTRRDAVRKKLAGNSTPPKPLKNGQ